MPVFKLWGLVVIKGWALIRGRPCKTFLYLRLGIFEEGSYWKHHGIIYLFVHMFVLTTFSQKLQIAFSQNFARHDLCVCCSFFTFSQKMFNILLWHLCKKYLQHAWLGICMIVQFPTLSMKNSFKQNLPEFGWVTEILSNKVFVQYFSTEWDKNHSKFY